MLRSALAALMATPLLCGPSLAAEPAAEPELAFTDPDGHLGVLYPLD